MADKKQDIRSRCLHNLIMDILEPKTSEESKRYREKLSDWIDKGILQPNVNWDVNHQEVLAGLIFEDDELVASIREQYLKLTEQYIEFERRYQEYGEED